MKFRLTRIRAYAYHRRGTLSLGWRYRWLWRPEWTHDWTGWCLIWLRFGLEWTQFEADDPWGERRGEEMAETWEMIANNLGDEP